MNYRDRITGEQWCRAWGYRYSQAQPDTLGKKLENIWPLERVSAGKDH